MLLIRRLLGQHPRSFANCLLLCLCSMRSRMSLLSLKKVWRLLADDIQYHCFLDS